MCEKDYLLFINKSFFDYELLLTSHHHTLLPEKLRKVHALALKDLFFIQHL